MTAEDCVDTALTSWLPFVASAYSCYRWEQRFAEGVNPHVVRAARCDVFREELVAAGCDQGGGRERGLAEGSRHRGLRSPSKDVTLGHVWPGRG